MPYDPRFCWVLSHKSYHTGSGTGSLFAVTMTLAQAKQLAVAFLEKRAHDDGENFRRASHWKHDVGKWEVWQAESDVTEDIVMIERVPFGASYRFDGGYLPDDAK